MLNAHTREAMQGHANTFENSSRIFLVEFSVEFINYKLQIMNFTEDFCDVEKTTMSEWIK